MTVWFITYIPNRLPRNPQCFRTGLEGRRGSPSPVTGRIPVSWGHFQPLFLVLSSASNLYMRLKGTHRFSFHALRHARCVRLRFFKTLVPISDGSSPQSSCYIMVPWFARTNGVTQPTKILRSASAAEDLAQRQGAGWQCHLPAPVPWGCQCEWEGGGWGPALLILVPLEE